METIPQDIVDSIWDEALDTPPEETQEKVQALFNSQPAIAAYLLYVEEEMMPPEERGVILMIGYCLLKAMLPEGSDPRIVTQEDIEDAEKKNLEMMESLEGTELDWMNQGVGFIKNYRQGPLLGSVLEALMEGNEDTTDDTRDYIGMVWLSMKAVIDCLDR
ncbi:MAG: hypothetical protein HYR88_13930 [Verrucomicrobia bacterium]|nr:hypothetical protein [Verrucomicrobiota bacterium]MBI3869905.1 hypothetical protein [Verrucomicrobiota bacterium]